MNENRDALKAELVQVVQNSTNAKRLIELQGTLLGKIKESILAELAMATSPKQVTIKKFLWFTIREETRSNLEHIESLQSDLRVILGYEALLEGTQNEGEVARLNLEDLRNKS